MSEPSRSRTPVVEEFRAQLFLKTTTANSGSGWVHLGNANSSALTDLTARCNAVMVLNNTSTELQFGLGTATGTSPTGETFELPTGTSFTFAGITDCRQLFVRRTDVDTTQKTFKAILFL